jgi:hypothetical protein
MIQHPTPRTRGVQHRANHIFKPNISSINLQKISILSPYLFLILVLLDSPIEKIPPLLALLKCEHFTSLIHVLSNLHSFVAGRRTGVYDVKRTVLRGGLWESLFEVLGKYPGREAAWATLDYELGVVHEVWLGCKTLVGFVVEY